MTKYEFHPFTHFFPMMPSHEIDALAADIKKFGQRVPIVVYGGKILDGRNRYTACQRAGIEPRIVNFTKSHPKEYVASANLFRRHLSTSDRGRIAALLSIESERGRPDKKTSNDVITETKAAEMLSVSVPTVQREKAKIRGKKKPPKPTETPDGELVDGNGTVIPKNALPYWNRKPEARNVLNQIGAARGQVRKLQPDDPMWSAVNLNGVLGALSDAYNRFTAAIPEYVCPYCEGRKVDGCLCCKGKGVISKYVWSTVPEELKKKRAK